MSEIDQARKHLARELGIRLPKKGICWIHRPEGWKRYRHVSLTRAQIKRRQAKTGRYQNSVLRPMRGKENCQHSDPVRNRAGRPLKDPDTGYLAQIHCRETARWERNDTTSGIFNVIARYCDKHAIEHGAPAK